MPESHRNMVTRAWQGVCLDGAAVLRPMSECVTVCKARCRWAPRQAAHGCIDRAGLPGALAAGGAPTHVDQSVLTVIAADTIYGLQVRISRFAVRI